MYKLSEKKYLEVLKNLEAHNMKELSMASKVFETLNQNGYDPSILREYIDDNVTSINTTNARFTEAVSYQPASIRCGACGEKTTVGSVNSAPGNQVGGDYRSVVSCMDMKNCGWQEFSEDKVKNVISKRGKAIKLYAKERGVDIEDIYITNIKMDRPIHGRP